MTPITDLEEENLSAKTKDYIKDLEYRIANLTQELNEQIVELNDTRKANLNILEDLREEKDQLKERNAKDEALLASIGDGVIATDKEGNIIMINHATETLLGWKSEELVGKKLSVFSVYDDKDVVMPFEKRPICITLLTSQCASATFFYKRKDGTKFPIAITATPVMLNKNIIGAIEIFRDVTREKELDRAKNDFISIASHQLRTPLTSIQWVAERFLKKEQLTPKGKEYLNNIYTSAKYLTELVDILLDLSRIEAGRFWAAPETLEVIGFVKNIIEEAALIQNKKELKIIFSDHPAELAVEIDKSALRNIVQNFVLNAIEYTPKGGEIEISIQKMEDKFIIKVRDNGVGIPKMEQAYIFEKFVRASNAKLYKTNGIGIGLYIVKSVVNIIGGKIWFDSEENKGSTFYAELPLKPKLEQKVMPLISK